MIANEPTDPQKKVEFKKQEMKKFLQQIKPVHYKSFTKMDLVFDCIDLEQPMITSIFDVYFADSVLVEWMESFNLYITQIEDVHMKTVLGNLASIGQLSLKAINDCRMDMIKGVYDVYIQTKDKEDAIQTLEKIVHKNFK